MIAFVLRRLAAAVLFVIVVSVAALILGRLAPADVGAFSPVRSAVTIAEERAAAGLDRPLLIQLRDWVVGLAYLDLGKSSVYKQPVRALVLQRAGATAELGAVALLLATLIGVPCGILTGAQPRGAFARLISPISIALIACPPIVGALGLLLLALTTGWPSTEPGSLALPALALALPLAAMLERLQSQATSEAISAPDLTAAAARGVPHSRLIWVHAARQSLRPVLGVYGIIIGSLFSGSLAVETIASWPGLGRLMYDALVARDLFLVAGCALAGAMFIAAGNFLADVLRALVDPRVRLA